MLTSVVVFLQSPTEGRLPASLGRAAQAALLRWVEQRDPALAGELHGGDGPRPYTVSNLVLGQRAQGSLRVKAGQSGWLRFTGLTPAVSEHLRALAQTPPPQMELDGHVFTVTGATVDPARHAWAGAVSYQDLAAPWLLGGGREISGRIELEFAGATTFRSGERWVPLPLPELVLWQPAQSLAGLCADCPAPGGCAVLRRSAVGLGRYRLESRGAPAKEWRARAAFTARPPLRR
jgi:CRISPR-associated endoribonuclease Cas6